MKIKVELNCGGTTRSEIVEVDAETVALAEEDGCLNSVLQEEAGQVALTMIEWTWEKIDERH